MSLCFRASDKTIERLRVVLATTYASGEDARDIDTAMEALGWMGLSTPPVQVLLKASGGNGKSARTVLRDNCFGSYHATISPTVFQTPDEFRIQGKQFAHARALTVQECEPGKPLNEEVWKRFCSGERLACIAFSQLSG